MDYQIKIDTDKTTLIESAFETEFEITFTSVETETSCVMSFKQEGGILKVECFDEDGDKTEGWTLPIGDYVTTG